ncbi:HAD-IB family hydrolase [Candidatus Azambacteria bacterium]|nr:HAD-IB family hydrolase [Candidatus Azambacteria bacterium]
MQNKIKLAVFDIDGTLFRSALIIQLIDHLVLNGIFPKEAKDEMEEDYLLWLNRQDSYDRYIKKVIEVHNKYIINCAEKDVIAVAEKVVDWQRDRVYTFTRDRVKEWKDEGYFLIAISGSPDYIVSKFTNCFGFNISYGSICEVVNGFFTGKINADSAARKDEILRYFLRNSSVEVDLGESYGVGDTEGDISFLSMVGKPIAFNPNRSLVKHAENNGWQIIIERKDVIYQLS